ncbi:thermonuclease family protein [Candidatus Saccharibacteria bacterium]|nr:thermonuclease family protein [Candidatus Saccharibacteria bacterium]
MNKKRLLIWVEAAILGLAMAGGLMFVISRLKPVQEEQTVSSITPELLYEVKSVIDGDTIKIDYEGKETSVRLIGVNTPETVDPRKTVECFGQEASQYLKNLLEGKKVKIEADYSQTDRDKYDRLLRYIYLDGEDVGYMVINNGYGYEYTYNYPYIKQSEYKQAQEEAEKNSRGLWAEGVCVEETKEEMETTTDYCVIKGNINNKGEKIYHMPGQQYYNQTQIDTSQGERWFCSEAEAQAAGWRKSKV